jgi:hypothetical protein
MSGYSPCLVIVLIVHEDRVLVFKSEGHPPVAVHLDRPMTCEITFQRMELPAWQTHCLGRISIIQNAQLLRKLLRVRWLYPGFRTGFEEFLEPAVLERLNHPSRVYRVALHVSSEKRGFVTPESCRGKLISRAGLIFFVLHGYSVGFQRQSQGSIGQEVRPKTTSLDSCAALSSLSTEMQRDAPKPHKTYGKQVSNTLTNRRSSSIELLRIEHEEPLTGYSRHS